MIWFLLTRDPPADACTTYIVTALNVACILTIMYVIFRDIRRK